MIGPHASKSPRPLARKRKPMLMAALLIIGNSACFGTAAKAAPAETCVAGQDAQQARPNFLIIVADDLGFADVGFNGATMPTPNIDRIARMGMRLDHFYTSALCSPTRAGLLTGRYPHRFGIMGETITPGSDFGLDPKEETIAQVMGRAGYARRSFLGKWHLGHRSPDFHPMSFGFTSFYGHYNGAIDYFTHEREGVADWHRDRTPSDDAGYSTELLTREAVRIICTPAPEDSPWLMWLAYNAPHGPLQAEQEDLAAVGFDPSKPRFGANESKRETSGYGQQGRGNSRRQTALAMIRALDRGVGHILDALERSGQLRNTVILFTSDNGGPRPWRPSAPENIAADNGPLRGAKFQHYEGGVRVAAAIAWPGHLEPRESANMGRMAYVDVLPTFARLANAEVDRDVDGRDVSDSILTGSPIPARDLFLGEDYTRPSGPRDHSPREPEALAGRAAAVIVGDWKLIGDELFDLKADPYETTDRAKENPALVEKMRERLDSYISLRTVPRERMNDKHLPPLPDWELGQRPDK